MQDSIEILMGIKDFHAGRCRTPSGTGLSVHAGVLHEAADAGHMQDRMQDMQDRMQDTMQDAGHPALSGHATLVQACRTSWATGEVAWPLWRKPPGLRKPVTGLPH